MFFMLSTAPKTEWVWIPPSFAERKLLVARAKPKPKQKDSEE